MNIYLLEQSVNSGYDTYDSVVVAAPSPEEAVKIPPAGNYIPDTEGNFPNNYSWADNIYQVTVELIGKAKPNTKAGVILGSFNAG